MGELTLPDPPVEDGEEMAVPVAEPEVEEALLEPPLLPG